MLNNRIKFDERYDDEEIGVTTLYFIAPKEMLTECGYNYPEAVSTEISLEFPLNVIVTEQAYGSISPTSADGEDYDWNDINLSYDVIDELIMLAEKSTN